VDDPNVLNPIYNVKKETDYETMRRYFANTIALALIDMGKRNDARFGEVSRAFFFLRQYSDYSI
jgi:hypothetical protein